MISTVEVLAEHVTATKLFNRFSGQVTYKTKYYLCILEMLVKLADFTEPTSLTEG